MYLKENMQIALEQLRSSKMRAILTLLGITIGIATVIFIVSILEGYNMSITAELNMLGANVFQVEKYEQDSGIQIGHRKREARKDLKKEYAKEIRESCSAVKFVGAEVWHYNISFKYKDKKTNPAFILAGGEPEFFINNAENADRGHIFTKGDVASHARVTVIGQDIVGELFPFEDPIGKEIKIAGTKFKVVGTFEDMGSRTFGGSSNNRAVIPITTFEDIFGGHRSIYLTVMAVDNYQLEEAKEQVIGTLRRIRKVRPGEDNDFGIWSNDSLSESFQNTADMIKLVAVFLGMISLLVGSIGVMNIMLVTVTERTREIGIRKAVGANRRTILMQFLNESVFLCLIGGTFGVILGFLAALGISLGFDIPFAVPIWIVIAALLVTSVVGLFAGIYPAAKASKLDPIDALRYE
jgi:putative ABC transport system permease protein